MKINFTKMVASGNDFIVLDNRGKKFSDAVLPKLAEALCARRLSVGADGLLVVERSKTADFRMRIFNPDGSEPDMCGNGARCIALYAKMNKIAKDKMAFMTGAGRIDAEVRKDSIKIRMVDPKGLKTDLSIDVDGKKTPVSFINTGVPHAVLFVQNLDEIDVVGLGRAIRYHKRFMPQGANVDFVKIEGARKIAVRTYERGVEEETLACGTGACASALLSAIVRGARSPVKVLTKSGEELIIYFSLKGEIIKDVYLEGKAKEVFSGEVKDV